MENKNSSFKIGMLLIASFFFINPFFSQNINKIHTSKNIANGVLYFIHKSPIYKDSFKNATLSYQINYSSNKDSLTFFVTLVSNKLVVYDNIKLFNSSKISSAPLQKLYVEPKSQKYVTRYNSMLSFNEFKDLISNEEFMKIMIVSNHDKSMTLEIARKKNIQNTIKEVFDLILLNK
ncbi:MAG: hypothetical protein MUE53_08750 [Chitinophagales bacterium]|jgi:hypothetical protein|nr:hypothetical protein [Chitinophagales bacterium]